MKINWQIITFAVMLIAVSCSKEKQTMSNGLVIEDIKIGDGQEVELSLIHISEPTRPY